MITRQFKIRTLLLANVKKILTQKNRLLRMHLSQHPYKLSRLLKVFPRTFLLSSFTELNIFHRFSSEIQKKGTGYSLLKIFFPY